MTDLDLCYMSANEALEQFQARKLSPVEIVKAQIGRAEKLEPKINAFADTYFDEALEQARASEDRYMSSAGPAGPLDGLTCVIKDEIKLKGRRTTGGSLIFKDHIDEQTDVFAQRLQDAGVIVHARTTTPEFCLLGTCQSKIWGITRNPHNLEYTPGGSSGGTGASLAAGTTTLGTGTDIGGSIRIPAGCSGIVGLKAAYGRIPETPVMNLDFYSHSGPMTRTVGDCLSMFNVSAGQSPRDIASLPGAMRITEALGDVRGHKIAWSADLGYFQISDDVRANTISVVEHLKELGAETEEIQFPWDESCQEAVQCYLAMLWGQHIKRLVPEHGSLMTDYALQTVKDAERFTMDDFVRSLEKAVEVYNVFGAQMEKYDAFICPTNGVPAVKADHDSWDADFRINDVVVDGEYGWVLTHPFNMLSRCPVISVPSGISDNSVPTGIQVVGAAYNEPAVFNVAAALEPAFGFQRPNI
ncbi:MAG: amidase [Alphaproteobacteria bacterium]|nr:amidase [Alphaproteobacteria bacterium]